MAAVNNVVTRGYSIGTIALVVLRGYTSAAVPITIRGRTVTLAERDLTLTLGARYETLSLASRKTTLTAPRE